MSRVTRRITADLRAWRHAEGLTQENAARKAKVSTRTFLTAEQGGPVDVSTVHLIARAMRRTFAEITAE